MNDLLEEVIEAHGGLERWNQLDKVSAHLRQGGALWALKGQPGVLDDVVVTVTLHQERVSHHPFGAADRRSRLQGSRSSTRSTTCHNATAGYQGCTAGRCPAAKSSSGSSVPHML